MTSSKGSTLRAVKCQEASPPSSQRAWAWASQPGPSASTPSTPLRPCWTSEVGQRNLYILKIHLNADLSSLCSRRSSGTNLWQPLAPHAPPRSRCSWRFSICASRRSTTYAAQGSGQARPSTLMLRLDFCHFAQFLVMRSEPSTSSPKGFAGRR